MLFYGYDAETWLQEKKKIILGFGFNFLQGNSFVFWFVMVWEQCLTLLMVFLFQQGYIKHNGKLNAIKNFKFPLELEINQRKMWNCHISK